MAESDDTDRAMQIRARLAEIEAEQRSLSEQLVSIERHARTEAPGALTQLGTHAAVTTESPAAVKIALFRRLFAGRDDVFPMRWENVRTGKSGYAPACANEWKLGVCDKPRVKCGECPNQAFIPVSADTIRRHLSGTRSDSTSGDFVAGAYPLLPDNMCNFLVVDFDGDGWAADSLAFVDAARSLNVTVALERSRSGEGGHVWLFFAEPLPARLARHLGSAVLTEAMDRRPEIGFGSYDRLFPSQDIMPAGGFGNLIALPLQHRARKRGNSVFIDDDLHPFDDQWAYLSTLTPIGRFTAERVVVAAETRGRVVGVRMPVQEDDAAEPWLAPPSRRPTHEPITGPLPASVEIVLADEVYVDRTAVPPPLVARLVRIAAFQNPEFFRAQAMRMSTHDKPRIISCADIRSHYVAIPRGCLDEARELLESHRISVNIVDKRELGGTLDIRFLGELRPEQTLAASALSRHDTGVLAAATAFGKTVVAASLIATRGRSTLVLVHRRELMTQWVERLAAFLSIDRSEIGIMGGGKRKQTGKIDVAVIQSLVRRGVVSDEIAGYGHLIVDECHHLSAASFELVARRSKARFVLGLSATVTRRDGHHPIILMQCGPVRYRVEQKAHASESGIEHRVILRPTMASVMPAITEAQPSITDLYRRLTADDDRNAQIVLDVAESVRAGRSPLVLTERRDHLAVLAASLRDVAEVIVLHGGMKSAHRQSAQAALRDGTMRPRVILATGRYLGEGFDDARLDTLFLALPIAWRGTLAQYVGRLHRDHVSKRDVLVYDYVDTSVPVLARMAAKRQVGYRALGYVITP